VADDSDRLNSMMQKLALRDQADSGYLQLNIQKFNLSNVLSEIRSDFSLTDSDTAWRGHIEKICFRKPILRFSLSSRHSAQRKIDGTELGLSLLREIVIASNREIELSVAD
jgi:hypothetical protein